MFMVICFPHTRGGVPIIDDTNSALSPFSPHTWGCTCGPDSQSREGIVFPTHVGVYLNVAIESGRESCFPHTRGGVPVWWGYFSSMVVVFPTHVGVYLLRDGAFQRARRFPHTRGGVPKNSAVPP